MPYYVELISLCCNDDTGKSKTFCFPFEFESEEDYYMYDGDGFDMLIELFNSALPKGWYVDDVIETVKEFDSKPENCLLVGTKKN